MPRVSAAFFLTGGLCVLAGMLWGIHMGASEDMATMPAHAHLNLLGWVTMALYGTFYALTAKTLSKRLAWTNYVLSLVGVAVLIPSLALFLIGRNPALIPVMGAGEILSVLALLVFLVSAVRELVRRRAVGEETVLRMAAE